MPFFFAIEGGVVGPRPICPNAMGAQVLSVVRKNIYAWLKLACIVLGFAAVCMLTFLAWLIGICRKEGKGEIVNCVASQMPTWAWAVFVFD
jgi:hypothetical protein